MRLPLQLARGTNRDILVINTAQYLLSIPRQQLLTPRTDTCKQTVLFGDSALEIYAHLALRPSWQHRLPRKATSGNRADNGQHRLSGATLPWLTQPAHILVFNRRPSPKARPLPCCPRVGDRSPLYRIANGIFLPGPELALIQAARGKRIEEIAYLGTILCSTFCFAEDSSTLLARAPLTFPADIAKISDRHRDVPGCAHVRSAVHWMLANAASPRECALGLVLHLPPRCGGYGLPQPSFNEPINLAEANKKLADRSYYVADLLWQTQQLIVEYDSDAFHLTSASHHHDSVRRAALEDSGYRVISITRNHFACIDEMNRAAATIARALKHPLRFRVQGFEERQTRLWRTLGLGGQ